MSGLGSRIYFGFMFTFVISAVIFLVGMIMYVAGWWSLLLPPILGISYFVGTFIFCNDVKQQMQKDYNKLQKLLTRSSK